MNLSCLKYLSKVWLVVIATICAIWSCESVQARELPSPTFLFSSGSARLIGMGDASVALADATGYNSNPGSLGLALENYSFVTSIGPTGRAPYGEGFGSIFAAVGNIPLFRKSTSWRCALSFVRQSSSPNFFSKTGRPDTDQNISGVVYGGTEYGSRIDEPASTLHSLTISAAHTGSTDIGVGIGIGNLKLDANDLGYALASTSAVNVWNLDLGLIIRRRFVMSNRNGIEQKTISFTPSFGASGANLVRTHVHIVPQQTYPPLTQDGIEDITRTDNDPVVVSSPLLRIGTSAAIDLSQHELKLVELIAASKFTQGGNEINDGMTIGFELSVFQTLSARIGSGAFGRYESMHTLGASVSTVGAQRLLFRDSKNKSQLSTFQHLLRDVSVTVSYAHLSSRNWFDLPKSFWTVTLSI